LRYLSTLKFAFAATLAVLLLSACGFALRGPVAFPFSSIYITLPEGSPFGADLKRNIRANGKTEIAKSAETADVTLVVMGDIRDKQILSVNTQGRAREYNLLYTFTFRVVDAHGRELLAPTSLNLKRSLSFNESVCTCERGRRRLAVSRYAE